MYVNETPILSICLYSTVKNPNLNVAKTENLQRGGKGMNCHGRNASIRQIKSMYMHGYKLIN